MTKLLLVLFLIAFAGIGLLVFAFKQFNGADAERYRKRRMQGPFVPLSLEDIAEDEARIADAKRRRSAN